MSKLWIEDGSGDAVKYQASDPGAGWTETTDPIDWDNYYNNLGRISSDVCSYRDFRNQMITSFEPSWGTYSSDQKKALVRNYVYPSETSTEDLDALYTSAERLTCAVKTMKKMSCVNFIPVKSTESDKMIDITVNDSLVVTAVEVTTDTTY